MSTTELDKAIADANARGWLVDVTHCQRVEIIGAAPLVEHAISITHLRADMCFTASSYAEKDIALMLEVFVGAMGNLDL